MTVVAAHQGHQAARWAGLALSALTTLFLLWDAILGLLLPDRLRAAIEETGFQFGQAGTIGGIALICAILYGLPWTAILGAILTTGFLGGAISTHFRLGEMGSPPQLVALLVGVMAWGGLYLRDSRLRRLLPFRAGPEGPTSPSTSA